MVWFCNSGDVGIVWWRPSGDVKIVWFLGSSGDVGSVWFLHSGDVKSTPGTLHLPSQGDVPRVEPYASRG